MREQYMRTGEGFVICYSVTDRRSFEEAVAYRRLIDRVRNQEEVPIVLVGNKCDLNSERKVLLLQLCSAIIHVLHSLLVTFIIL